MGNFTILMWLMNDMDPFQIRKYGGKLRVQISEARVKYKKNHSFENFINYFFSVFAFIFGSRVTKFIKRRIFLYFYSIHRYSKTHSPLDLRIKKLCRVRFLHGVKYKKYRYVPPALQYSIYDAPVLYHATKCENEKSIFEQGLKPGKKLFVFLTDNTDYYKNKNLPFGTLLLRIDIKRLRESGHVTYVTTAKNEFITDYVPPECIEKVKSSLQN